MTDYTKLIEELRLSAEIEAENKGSDTPNFEEYWLAADAVEALQGENLQLRTDLNAELQGNAAMRMRLGAKDGETMLAFAERLASQLDAMGKGEPVAQGDPVPLYRAAINCPHEIDHEQVILKYDPKQPGHNALNQLGRRLVEAVSAPKALAPMTDEQIYNVFASTVKEAEPFLELVGDPIWAEVVEITRAIEAAHGIK